ncbi:serine/threonine-protein kinase [Thiolapillus brandeum]|uniref:non-specific serine/threonine protein kinase n=1 Tax=Thiolapillus brandeum TaxID=1076588 RepID=A0A7U6JIX6_9GAMM|nr:serine/threonine-protein kinase [Thiolapillus brandeum]BAO45218.1 hypothetical protein TBH_C2307 [Thiolapillus brandeum]
MATDESALHIPGYKILHLVGRGANATVYLALQESLNRHVALKILQKFDRPAQAVRFFNEGQIVASMNHPNIITIYDIGSVGSQQYIAMEYLDGGSLKEKIRDKPSPAEALDIVQSIGSALDFVHQMDIVHRDIKPENILFHKRGMPKITDFGVAKALDRDMNLTMDGTALGSPYYLSPEQAEGKDLDGRSDIYSLGVILFEMLAGHKPYRGESQIEVIFGHLNQPIPSLPEEHRHYQGLVEKMMAKNPQDRFSSAQEMLQYMNALRNLGDSGTGGQIPNLDRRSQRSKPTSTQSQASLVRRNPWLTSLAAMLVLGSAAAFLLPISPSHSPETEQPVAEASGDKTILPDSGPVTLPASKMQEDIASEHENTSGKDETPDFVPASNMETPSDSSTETQQTRTAVSPETGATLEQLAASLTGEQDQPNDHSVSSEIDTVDTTPEDTTPDLPATDTDTQIEALLSQAADALKKYRLTSPRNSSAYHYYREILKLDPHNKKASRGIRNIAGRYGTLAKKALEKGDEAKARAYTRRGLNLNPRSKPLLAMQKELDELEAARLAPPPPPPEPVKPPPPAPKPEPVNNGLQLLDSLE